MPYKNQKDQREAQARYAAKNTAKVSLKVRRWRLKTLYGITQEDYEEMLEAQNGVCAICFSPSPKSHCKFFAVDHDHTTGKVRGLLCSACNRALGLLNDSEEIVNRAARYLGIHNRAD